MDEVPWYENESIRELAQQLATVCIGNCNFWYITFIEKSSCSAGYSSGPGAMVSDDEDDVDDKIEVQEGESLEDIKAKLKPKKAAIC